MSRALCALLPLLLAGCPGDKDSSATDDSADDSGADDSGGAGTYNIEGQAILFGEARDPAPEGTCIDLLDPTNGVTGGEPEVLGQTTSDAGGMFSFTDVPRTPYPPLLMATDCTNELPLSFPTGTVVAPGAVAEVADGGTVSGAIAEVLGVETFDEMKAALEASGSTVDLAADGMMFGFFWEEGTETAIAGASLPCAGCTVYYADDDSGDGPYSTGGSLNTASSDIGFFVAPGAPIGEYTPTAPGYGFQAVPAGAIPSGALFMVFFGTPE